MSLVLQPQERFIIKCVDVNAGGISGTHQAYVTCSSFQRVTLYWTQNSTKCDAHQMPACPVGTRSACVEQNIINLNYWPIYIYIYIYIYSYHMLLVALLIWHHNIV